MLSFCFPICCPILLICIARLYLCLYFRQYEKHQSSCRTCRTMTIDLYQFYLSSQVLENLVSFQIQLHLNNNSLLYEEQSAFCTKRRFITAITNIVEDIRQKLDRNCITFLTLLDHSKTFDSINHYIL